MKIRRILVVYKKSAYQLYARERRDPKFIRLLRGRAAVADRFVSSHESHRVALREVEEMLRRRQIAADFVYRAQSFDERSFDLVLSVGGDGTFLEASHGVRNKPLLGVNSSPADSVGIFCGAGPSELPEALERFEKGTLPVTRMTRLRVRIGGQLLPVPVMNDVLITHNNPAATSRYIIQFLGRTEEQKSSGIWVAPPAGSTGAVAGAGGAFLPIRSPDAQYVVRELYRQPGKRFFLQRGRIRPREKFTVISKMRAGLVFLDGAHLEYPFGLGERLTISADAPPLHVLGFDESRRRKFWG